MAETRKVGANTFRNTVLLDAAQRYRVFSRVIRTEGIENRFRTTDWVRYLMLENFAAQGGFAVMLHANERKVASLQCRIGDSGSDGRRG